MSVSNSSSIFLDVEPGTSSALSLKAVRSGFEDGVATSYVEVELASDRIENATISVVKGSGFDSPPDPVQVTLDEGRVSATFRFVHTPGRPRIEATLVASTGGFNSPGVEVAVDAPKKEGALGLDGRAARVRMGLLTSLSVTAVSLFVWVSRRRGTRTSTSDE